MMRILQLLAWNFLFKDASAEVLSETTLEKVAGQFAAVFTYTFGGDTKRPISQDVSFNLYTRKNPLIPQVLPPRYPSLLPLSYFNSKLKTYFVIHGFTDHLDREIIAKLRLALIASENANVIVVDWGRLAQQMYFDAVESTLPVGTYVGEFLSSLEGNSVDLGKIHLIGHSLGAHISGIAGALVGGRLGRITGLDPAGPLFEFIETRNESVSLDKGDGRFVDVIHTDGDEFGVTRPIGDADFYPNEGTSPQPGCNNVLTVVTCSHVRSVEFYTESILREAAFEARHCNVTRDDPRCLQEEPVLMGHHVSTKAKGLYFLETNAASPFAKRPEPPH